MPKNLEKAVKFLPFAFFLHNFEEVWGMAQWTQNIPAVLFQAVTTKQFAVAAAIFSILGLVVIFVGKVYLKEAVFLSLVAGFAGMLLLNVFFPHLIMTIYFRQYAPGIITAVFINLPLTIYILQAIWKTRKLNRNQFILAIMGGGLIGLMLVFLLLKIGEFLTS